MYTERRIYNINIIKKLEVVPRITDNSSDSGELNLFTESVLHRCARAKDQTISQCVKKCRLSIAASFNTLKTLIISYKMS